MTSLLRFLTAATLMLAGAALADPPEPEFDPAALRSHVAFLADDALEGREAGSPGYARAADYVARQFAAAGLDPGAGGGWLQPVPIVERRLAAEPARLTIGSRTLIQGDDFMMGPPHDEIVEGEAVFAGHGLVHAGLGLDDYAGLDVRGRIVVLLAGTPPGIDGAVAAHLSREKLRFAAERGAVGVLVIRPPEAQAQRSWEQLRRALMTRPSALAWAEPDGSPHEEARGVRAVATLNAAAAEALFEGAPRSLPGLWSESAPRPGSARGFPLRHRVRLESRSSESRFTDANVVARVAGADPSLDGEYVLLLAHLDGEGGARGPAEDPVFNGALDNAAGVAAIIEVARALAAAPTRPRRTVLIAAVASEERGFVGSDFLASHPVRGGRMVAAVNVDTPLLLYRFEDVIAFGQEHSTLGEAVARTARRMGVAVSPDPRPAEGAFTRSDHYSFVRRGIPALMLTTGIAGPGRDAWRNYYQSHYHRPSDDLGLPIDWQAAGRFAELTYLLVREIADAEQAPGWHADSFFGRAFAPAAITAAPARSEARRR